MGWDGERGDYGVPAQSVSERKLSQEERRSLLKVCHRFFDGFALRSGSGFRIQRDETAFFGGRKDGSEFHGNAPTGDWTSAFSRKATKGPAARWTKGPAARWNTKGLPTFR